MITCWKFYRGEWSEVPFSFEWKDQENLEDALVRAGYSNYAARTFGLINAGFSLEFYTSKKDSSQPARWSVYR